MFMRWKEYWLGLFKQEGIYDCVTQSRLGFTVSHNKGWFLSPCSSWDIWGLWNKQTEHSLCRTLLIVMTEGKENMAKHELTFKTSA